MHVFATLAAALSLTAPDPSATALVNKSLDAMGGKDLILRISRVTMEGLTYEHFLEQSERPEGPYYTNFTEFTETFEPQAHMYKVVARYRGAASESWINVEGTIDYSDPAVPKPNGRFQYRTMDPRLKVSLSPERALLLALSSDDLQMAPDAVVEKVAHKSVQFHWGKTPVRIYLNSYTNLPTAVEFLSEGPLFWPAWGDVTTRLIYGAWEIKPGGFKFPMLWTVSHNGWLQNHTMLTKATAEFADQPADIGPWLKAMAPAERQVPKRPYKEADVRPGIVQYQGNYNVEVVDQGDGLVLIEATTASDYMEDQLAAIEKRFPGKRIKAVVSTSDAWPHFAGMRPMIARGIPLYILDINRPLIERLSAAPFTLRPDLQQTNKRKTNVTEVKGKVVIGSGTNQLVVYPIRGEGSERMLMVYFPEQRLLYGSDLVQFSRGEFYNPQYLDELRAAVEREGLQVDSVMAMHSAERPWKEVLDAIAKAKAMPATPR